MNELIESLGDKDNEYIIKNIRGRWWILHNVLGNGEPLEQWLEQYLPIEENDLLKKVRQNLIEHWHWENSQEQPDMPFCSHSRLASILEMTVSELREFENKED